MKIAKVIASALGIALICWIGISILEIGMRSLLAENHVYSPLNFVELMIEWFGGAL